MRADTALRRTIRSLRYDVRNIVFALRHCRQPMAIIGAILRREREPSVTLRDGTTIAAPEMRTVLWLLEEIFIDRAYDHDAVSVQRGDCVVDIGAHVGVFAVYAVKRGAARVIAYEPSPYNARLLRANVARNSSTHGVTPIPGAAPASAAIVEVVEAAVSDNDGRSILGIGRMSAGNVLVEHVSNESVGEAVSVRTTTIAGVMREHGLDRIDYLKIDCEGSEGAVLSAASDADLRRVDRIALEYHDDWSSLNHQLIAKRLRSVEFVVDVVPQPGTSYGMIYAWRTK